MAGFGVPRGPTNAPINYVGLNVGSSQWNAPVPVFWGMRRLSTNAMWFNDFKAKPASGKGKGGGGKGDQQMTYTASVCLGLCEGDSTLSVGNIWADGSTTTTTTLSALNMSFFSGTLSQAPWSYVTTNYPAQARSYSQTAYLGAANLPLGESATIPDNAFECTRTAGFAYTKTSSTSGWINPNSHAQSAGVDCLMSDIITDALTRVQYGMGFSSGDIGPITQYATYQRAQGLFFSPLCNSQEKMNELIDRWAISSNAWIYWSGTQLQFVPLGDSVVTGNGVTYTPVDDVAYNLGPDDFLTATGKNGGIVAFTRVDPDDAKNRTVLTITDRTLGYIDNPFEWKDDGLVDQFRLKDDSSTQADEICDPAVARIAVQLIGKRAAYIRNNYAVTVSSRYILCIPGTILTLTDPTIPISMVRVRVKTVARSGKDKDGKGTLAFVCEEFPGNVGTYYPPVAAAAIDTATTPVTNIAPGNINTPAVIEPASTFTGGVPKIIVAASGGETWGGAIVTLSFNGSDYSTLGTINAPAKQGVLTAALAAYAGANPDTTDTLSVDCTQSLTTPTPVDTADAEALRTLSLVAAQPVLSGGAYVLPSNGELLAFGDVSATGTYAADLSYLERGAYGTGPGAHSIGDQFTQIDVTGTDGTSVAFDIPPQYIGATIYLKLLSFNVFKQALQDPSTVVEYQYTPTGAGYGAGTAGAPLEPTGFGIVGSPGSNAVALGWAANAPADNVTSYTLWRAPGTGASFGSAVAVWSGAALADTDASLSGGTGYTYFLTANNAVGASPNTSGVDATTAEAGGAATSVVAVSASPYALGAPPAATWYVDIDNTSGGALEVDLPVGTPGLGQRIIITDAGGNAGTNAFTIKAGVTIDTIGVNNGWSTCRWNGVTWLRSA